MDFKKGNSFVFRGRDSKTLEIIEIDGQDLILKDISNGSKHRYTEAGLKGLVQMKVAQSIKD